MSLGHRSAILIAFRRTALRAKAASSWSAGAEKLCIPRRTCPECLDQNVEMISHNDVIEQIPAIGAEGTRTSTPAVSWWAKAYMALTHLQRNGSDLPAMPGFGRFPCREAGCSSSDSAT